MMKIERMDSKYVPFEVYAFLQSCSSQDEGVRDWALETFALCDTDTHPLPAAAYKLRPGERCTVNVVYEIEAWNDYYGEADTSLAYKRERVLKRPKHFRRYDE